MLRAVIDTNVVVKGLFVAGSRQDRVLRLIGAGRVTVAYSMEMIKELLAVIDYSKIRKSFLVDGGAVEKYVRLIEKNGRVVVPEKMNLCRDVKDNVVLGTAMTAAAFGGVSLVTEDEDLLVLKGKVGGVRIVTPGEFLESGVQ